MLDKILFLGYHPLFNSPTKETISAGLGPSEQYIISLIALLFIGLWVYFSRKKKK